MRMISTVAIGFVLALVTAATPAAAQFAVVDVANIQQTTVSAVQSVAQVQKQIQQYTTQLQQYQNMLQNTLAPEAYIWSQAQSTIDGLQNSANTLTSLTRQSGSIDSYLNQFQNPNYYRSSPCFSATGCTPEQRAALQTQQRAKQQLMMASNDDVLRGISNEQTKIKAESAKLEQMQSNAQSAQGQMQALGYANQFAADQNAQLLAIRQQLMAQQAAAAVQQAAMDENALRVAASEKARSGSYKKSQGGTYTWQ